MNHSTLQADDMQPSGSSVDVVNTDKPVSFFEFWPAWLFYFPLKLYGAFLALRYGDAALPTVANPLFDAGGFVGESKTQILSQVPENLQHLVAEYTTVIRTPDAEADTVTGEAAMAERGLHYPIVVKPDIGCRGLGVQRVYNRAELTTYLQTFPVGETCVLQNLYDYPNEVGLFYIRMPGHKHGFIFSLTQKHFAHVTGDSTRTLRQLIETDPRAKRIAHIYLPRHKDRLENIIPAGVHYRIAFAGSHSRGTVFKNAAASITPAMTQAWDALCQQIPEFYFGRFDVRYNNAADLERAENIKIIEINGAGAEATHVWDANTTLARAYADLAKQYHWLFKIGAANKRRGFKPMSIMALRQRLKKHIALEEKYPLTH